MSDIGLTGFVYGQDRTPYLDKGLTFLYQQDLIVTGNFWNVIVNIDLKWYRTQINIIDLILQQIDTYQKNPRWLGTSRYVSWQEITYLHAVWEQLNLEFEDMERLLPVTHQKRGLLNFGGEILNFLFGTATSTKLHTLRQVVEGIKQQQITITHSIEHQLTYTKELDQNVRQNTRDVTLLARILKLQVNDIIKLNSTVKELETNLLKRLELMANTSQTVRELEFFCLQLEQEFLKIRQGLDVTSTGKLSAELLPPHNLSQILQQVALKLPADVSLVAGTGLDDMFIYYEMAKVQAYATPSEIRPIIRLPLRGADRVMNLYRTEPLPVYEAMLKRRADTARNYVYGSFREQSVLFFIDSSRPS